MWQATGAGHYTSDDVLLGVAKQNNERKKKVLIKKKEIALKNNKIVEAACTILVQAKGVENYNIQELKVLLRYYKIKVTGMTKRVSRQVEGCVAKWSGCPRDGGMVS